MPQVAAVLTPSTAPQVAAAIIAAYQDLRGRTPPSKNSWLWPLALSSNETAQWSSMYDWNAGNVTTSKDTVPWYFNPRVTDPLKFRSFTGLRAGALSMLKALDQHGGIAAADAGDQNGWQSALNGYLGGPYPSPWTLVASLSSTQPEGGFHDRVISPSAQGSPIAAIAGVVALAVTVGFGLYKAFENRPEPEEESPFAPESPEW